MKDARTQPEDPGAFVGSAVVAGVSYGAKTTLLKLQTFSACLNFEVCGVPDQTGVIELGAGNFRPLSVKIQDGGQRCHVIALTSDGTRHMPFSLRRGSSTATVRGDGGCRWRPAGGGLLFKPRNPGSDSGASRILAAILRSCITTPPPQPYRQVACSALAEKSVLLSPRGRATGALIKLRCRWP